MNIKIFEGKNLPHELHCVKSVRIRSYSGPNYSHIFPHSDWILRDTEYLPYSVRMRENAGEMWTRITPNMDFFDAVLSLTIRQKTKLRNPFENNMSTDIKLSKIQISKII